MPKGFLAIHLVLCTSRKSAELHALGSTLSLSFVRQALFHSGGGRWSKHAKFILLPTGSYQAKAINQ